MIAQRLGCRGDQMLIGAEATADRVRDHLEHASLIHLACHGRFLREQPFGSGLRLADRWLTLREIGGLRLNADLITLSGCETGLNLVSTGDELLGVLHSFFSAGAVSMLVSLWHVDDEHTRELMSLMYDAEMRPADSSSGHLSRLRSAQLALLDQHPHPTFWAPFTLVGSHDNT